MPQVTLIFRPSDGGKPWGMLYVVDASQRAGLLEAIRDTLDRVNAKQSFRPTPSPAAATVPAVAAGAEAAPGRLAGRLHH